MPTYALEAVAKAICAASGFSFGGVIGQGAFKETFVATKPDGTKLAIKVLKPGCSTERSAREVDAMKRCAHPNVIALLELSEIDHEGTRYGYLIESFMEGGTLEDRIRGGLLDRNQLLGLGESLIRAVGHIADLDLVHRDFKPANILYPAVGEEAVVADFGIVRDLKKESLTKSYLSPGPGTPFFAAPEQLNNEKALIDWRTDQFAIGVTLAVVHFGVHPYRRDGEDDGQAIGRVAARSGPSPAFIEAADKSKLPVLLKMVAPWPAERVRTPSALLDAWHKQKAGH